METWRLARTESALPGHGTGVPELLSTMRVTRRVGRLLGLVPNEVLDRVYAQIARHRGSLGRLVPDGHAPRRFP